MPSFPVISHSYQKLLNVPKVKSATAFGCQRKWTSRAYGVTLGIIGYRWNQALGKLSSEGKTFLAKSVSGENSFYLPKMVFCDLSECFQSVTVTQYVEQCNHIVYL